MQPLSTKISSIENSKTQFDHLCIKAVSKTIGKRYGNGCRSTPKSSPVKREIFMQPLSTKISATEKTKFIKTQKWPKSQILAPTRGPKQAREKICEHPGLPAKPDGLQFWR